MLHAITPMCLHCPPREEGSSVGDLQTFGPSTKYPLRYMLNDVPAATVIVDSSHQNTPVTCHVKRLFPGVLSRVLFSLLGLV